MLDWITGIAYLLIILSVLVIAHEWGHFIVAKLCGMRVEEFSLFFGKRLVRLGKRGETEYNIRSIPLGGFVKIAGMDADDISGGRPILEALRHPAHGAGDPLHDAIEQLDTDSLADINASNVSTAIRSLIQSSIDADGTLTENGRADLEMKQASPQVNDDERKLIQIVLQADSRAADPGLYSQKPIYKRALTIFAGPFMSLFFGYFLFCVMGMTIGLPGEELTNQVQVIPDGAARAAGMRTGDRIIAIDGKPTRTGKALTGIIHANAGRPLHFTVQRGDQTLGFTITPKPTDMPKFDEKANKLIADAAGKPILFKQGVIGVMPNSVFERHGAVQSVTAGTFITINYIRQLGTVLRTPKGIKESVGGPIAMGQQAVALQKLGFAYMVSMAAMLSLGLGIMNLLPIPILDGGHLLLLGIEKIRRRRLTPREVYRAQVVGLAMLAVLVGFVMINDLMRTLSGHGFQ